MKRALALIQADSRDGEQVLTVRGEIDVATTAAMRDWLARASAGGRRSLTVDLRRVDFLAIGALYVLCDEQQRMAAHRARLTVVAEQPRVLRLLSVCRLDEVLHVVPGRPAGRDAWSTADDARSVRLGVWLRRYAAVPA